MSTDIQRFVQKSAQLGEQIETLQRKGRHHVVGDPHMWEPLFDLYHFGESRFIDIELPGVPPAAVEVETEPAMILVKGAKPIANDHPTREDVVSMRRFGSFACSFAAPPGQVIADVVRRMAHGVLHLKVTVRPQNSAHDTP